MPKPHEPDAERHSSLRSGEEPTLVGPSLEPSLEPTIASDSRLTLPASGLASGSGLRRDAMLIERGTMLGPFRIEGQLGRGGMGVVYAATDTRLDRRVAIKLLLDEVSGSIGSDRRVRLEREARALARLSHPNVVQVFEIGEHAGRLYIVMECVDGVTLREHWDRLDGADDRWRAVVATMIAAGEGLLAAHEAGLVHRDFKPDNVLIDRRGRVRVMDFGVAHASIDAKLAAQVEHARAGEGELALTQTGALLGTPAYMSPEQLTGGLVDARSDQFGFCVVLYEGLYGHRPWQPQSMGELVEIMSRCPPPEFPSGIAPPGLAELLRRGLARDPGDRFTDLGDLLDALRSFETTDSGPGRGAVQTTARVFGIAAAAILVGAVAWWAAQPPAPPSEPEPEGPAALSDGVAPAPEQVSLRRIAWLDDGDRFTAAPDLRFLATIDPKGERLTWIDLRDGKATTTEFEPLEPKIPSDLDPDQIPAPLHLADDPTLYQLTAERQLLAYRRLRLGRVLSVSASRELALVDGAEDGLRLVDLASGKLVRALANSSQAADERWLLAPDGASLARVRQAGDDPRQLDIQRTGLDQVELAPRLELELPAGFALLGHSYEPGRVRLAAASAEALLVYTCEFAAARHTRDCASWEAPLGEALRRGVERVLPGGRDGWWALGETRLGSLVLSRSIETGSAGAPESAVPERIETRAQRPEWLGERLILLSEHDGELVWSAAHGRDEIELPAGHELLGASFEGPSLLRRELDGVAVLWSPDAGELREVPGSAAWANTIARARCRATRCLLWRADGAELRLLDTTTAELETPLQCPADAVCTPGAGDLAPSGALVLPGPARVQARYYAAPDRRAKPIPALADATLIRFGSGANEFWSVEDDGRTLVRVRDGARTILWQHARAQIRDLSVGPDGQLALEIDDYAVGLYWLGPPREAPDELRKGPFARVRSTLSTWSIHDQSSDGLDLRSVVRSVVRSNIEDVRECYDEALSHDPEVAGRVDIRFTIEPSGNVSLAEVVDSEYQDPFLGSCIAGKSMTWRFPAGDREGSIKVTWPFELSPG
jgi:hypothetical protein